MPFSRFGAFRFIVFILFGWICESFLAINRHTLLFMVFCVRLGINETSNHFLFGSFVFFVTHTARGSA